MGSEGIRGLNQEYFKGDVMEYKRYDIIPVAKPRMTRRDSAKSKQNRIQGMRKCVAKYYAFKNQVQAAKVEIPEAGSHIIFLMPMPKSWSKKEKQKRDLKRHQQTPDKDNLEKALLDAVFGEDKHIWDSRVTKIWSLRPGFIIKTTSFPSIFNFNEQG